MAIITIKENENYACRFYYLDYFGRRQRVYKSGFPTKRAAKEFEAIEKSKLEGKSKYPDMKLSPFIDDVWYPIKHSLGIAITTLDKYEDHIPTIKRDLGHLMLSGITSDHLQYFLNQFQDKPCTQNEYRKLLQNILNVAIEEELLLFNPIKRVRTVGYKPKSKVPYFFSDVEALYKKLKEKNSKLYTPVVLALVFSESREEVTAGLESDITRIEDGKFAIQIDKAYVTVKGKGYVTRQKTDSRARFSIFDDTIYDQIRWFKKHNDIASEFLCCNLDGSRISPNTISNEFPEFLSDNNLKHITFHGLRTSFANLCKRAGIDPDTCFRLMGHANFQTTVEHYNKVDDVLIFDATTKLADRMFRGNKCKVELPSTDIDVETNIPL